MKYIVYQTINLVNNKIYIGVHKTENPDVFDGYLGEGVYIKDQWKIKHPKCAFHYALKKYGIHNFKRSTLKIFDTLEEALKLEAELVNKDFVLRKDNYNIALGGGMPPIKCIPVYQYSLDGKFITEYASILDASKVINVDDSATGYAARNKTTSGNFLWSFDKVPQLDFTMELQKKKVYAYDSNGQLVKEFESVSDCAKQLDVTFAPVQRAYKWGGKIKEYYLYYEKLKQFVPDKNRLDGKIHKYTLQGEYLCTYNSLKEVESDFNCKMSGINTSIRMGKAYKGYVWRRGETPELQVKAVEVKKLTRKIGQYTLDGKLIKIYKTTREARKDFSNVNKVLKGTAKQCKGYTFKYIE